MVLCCRIRMSGAGCCLTWAFRHGAGDLWGRDTGGFSLACEWGFLWGFGSGWIGDCPFLVSGIFFFGERWNSSLACCHSVKPFPEEATSLPSGHLNPRTMRFATPLPFFELGRPCVPARIFFVWFHFAPWTVAGALTRDHNSRWTAIGPLTLAPAGVS